MAPVCAKKMARTHAGMRAVKIGGWAECYAVRRSLPADGGPGGKSSLQISLLPRTRMSRKSRPPSSTVAPKNVSIKASSAPICGGAAAKLAPAINPANHTKVFIQDIFVLLSKTSLDWRKLLIRMGLRNRKRHV